MDIIYNHDGIRLDVENIEEKVKRLEIMLASTVEECILLKKQIQSIRKERDNYKEERDAYKLYVPDTLLTMGHLIKNKGSIRNHTDSMEILYK